MKKLIAFAFILLSLLMPVLAQTTGGPVMGGGSPNANNVAVTNDTTTDATMYPTWVTANTGNLPIKVSSTKLTFNPSSGTWTTVAAIISGNTASSFIYSDAAKTLVTTTAPTNGQLLIGSTGAIPALGTITGTTNETNVTLGAGTIQIGLPDNVTVTGDLTVQGSVNTSVNETVTGDITLAGSFLTGLLAGNNIEFKARDVDGAAYTTFATLTANDTPTFDLADSVTKGGQYIYRAGGTDVAVGDGGTGVSTFGGTNTILFTSAADTLGSFACATAATVVQGGSPPTCTATPSVTSLATSAATPLLLTNGQLVNIALTSQTVGATTLTIPDFASVVDSFAFTTLAQELDNKTLDSSVGKGTWTASGTWTLPALTLGGTVSGGGNQINNVVIGAVTPLAGSFTTVTGTGDSTFTTSTDAIHTLFITNTKAAGQGDSVVKISKAANGNSADIWFTKSGGSGATDWQIGTGIAAADDKFRIYNGDGTIVMVSDSAAGHAVTFAPALTTNGITNSSGNVTGLGAATGTSLALTGLFSTTLNTGTVFQASATGTGNRQLYLGNSGTDAFIGIESSVGGTIQTGAPAYALALVGTAGKITIGDGTTKFLEFAAPGAATFAAGITATSATLSGLTSGRVPIAGVGGLLGDDADLTFLTDTLTAAKLTVSTGPLTVSANGAAITGTTTSSGFKTTKVTGLSVDNATATTVIDLTTIASSYTVDAGASIIVSGGNSGGVNAGFGYGVVTAHANGAEGMAFTVDNGGANDSFTFSISGNNLQVTQTTGATRTMQFTFLYMSLR